MSVQTTTYIHVHIGDEVTVKPGSPVDESGTIVRLGDLADVALFLDRESALQLARDILARYAPVSVAHPPVWPNYIDNRRADRVDVDDMYPEEQDAYWGYAH